MKLFYHNNRIFMKYIDRSKKHNNDNFEFLLGS